ncbi:heme-binding beta-barrel domain-containing protein [Lutibacter holmesii]|uniref:Heme-binding beta-barrel domain-containing protein n=1 Tax=Lutibacter holmesii TaxID=1137985 RepID=A0ABW3WLB3_9FLAO
MSEVTEINYGPLKEFIGVWKGDKGMDIAPESDGTEENPYYETITFEEGGDLTNGEEQVLAVLHYRRIVKRKSNDGIFHDETGYWMWDAKENVIMHSLNIPRAVSLLAGVKLTDANYKNGKLSIDISAGIENNDWGIVQSPFMKEKALTKNYRQVIEIENGKMTYAETTMLDIYGREFEHTDKNELILQS